MPDQPPPFTPRETEVLLLVMAERSNKEIAQALGIALDTVKSHLSRILKKCRARNRGELRHMVRKGKP